MPDVKQVLEYARTLAEALGQDMRLMPDSTGWGPYWEAPDLEAKTKVRARAVAALEFFETYAGANSSWTRRATTAFEKDDPSMETGAREVGEYLRTWADQVDAGIAEIVGARAWAEVGIVSTDVMGQVRRLLEDRAVHPAAPIVLCGSAIEIALRALANAKNVTLPAKPTISTSTTALRAAGILTVQEVKDLEAIGGVRNSAAHGHFDELDAARAGLLEQQTNMMLRRLTDLMS